MRAARPALRPLQKENGTTPPPPPPPKTFQIFYCIYPCIIFFVLKALQFMIPFSVMLMEQVSF